MLFSCYKFEVCGPYTNDVCLNFYFLGPPCRYLVHATSLPLVRNWLTNPHPSVQTSYLHAPLRLWLPETVFQLAEGGEESSAVGLEVAALLADPKLHREPVALKREWRLFMVNWFL